MVSGGMFLFLVVVDARFHPVAASLAMVTSHLHVVVVARVSRARNNNPSSRSSDQPLRLSHEPFGRCQDLVTLRRPGPVN